MRPCTLLCTCAVALAACGTPSTLSDAPRAGDGAGADSAGTVPIVAFPTTLAIGAGDCGGVATATFTADNTGGGALTYAIASSGPIFDVTPSSGTISPAGSTTFTVTAHVPVDAVPGTAITGALTITSNASSVPVTIALSADPRGGVVALAPASASFGDVELGGQASQAIHVENHGNAAVGVAIGASSGGDFAVAFTGGALDAAASRDATVTYTPGGLGAGSASAAITITGAVCGLAPTSLAMSGKGVPIGSVLVTGNPAFGTVDCGTVGTVSKTLTLDNQGAAPATWTAALLADAQGDDALYTLSAPSGTVAAGAQATFDVNRLAVALPATPGAHDAIVRVTTTVASVPTVHDVAITQTLRGPFLTAGAASIDFGFAPDATTLARTVTVSNSGNASAAASYGESGTYFDVPEDGGTITGGGGTGTFTARFTPTAPGVTTGDVAITAAGACSGARHVALAAGTGPWTSAADTAVARGCTFGSNNPGTVFVSNPGNQPLTLSSCVDVSGTDIHPAFTPDPLSVGSGGGSGGLQYSWSDPAPLRSGATTATIRCDTNEKFFTTRTFQLTRTMNGADLTLAPVDTLDFSCTGGFSQQHFIRVTNDGNTAAFLFAESNLPNGLFTLSAAFTLDPGASNQQIGAGMASGGCTPGDSGTLGVFTGSADVCSASPSDHLQVTTSP